MFDILLLILTVFTGFWVVAAVNVAIVVVGAIVMVVPAIAYGCIKLALNGATIIMGKAKRRFKITWVRTVKEICTQEVEAASLHALKSGHYREVTEMTDVHYDDAPRDGDLRMGHVREITAAEPQHGGAK